MYKKAILATALALSAVAIPAALPQKADAQIVIGGRGFRVGVGTGYYGGYGGYYGYPRYGYYGGYRPYYGSYYTPYYGGYRNYGYYAPRVWRRW
jgi:hypothetical protein